MTITFVASAEGVDDANGTTITIPSTVAPGHRLLAIVATNSVSGYSHLAPPGWALVATSYGSTDGGSQFASLFTRVAQLGDANTPTEFVVTPTGSKDAAALVAYSGSDSTPGIAASAFKAHSGTAGTTITVPSINVDALPTTLVAAASKKGGTADVVLTPPTGFNMRGSDTVAGNGAIGVAVAGAPASATGPTSVAPWGSSVSSAAATAFLVALKEGPPPVLKAPVFRRLTVDGWYPAQE